jgi:hypothetical protein
MSTVIPWDKLASEGRDLPTFAEDAVRSQPLFVLLCVALAATGCGFTVGRMTAGPSARKLVVVQPKTGQRTPSATPSPPGATGRSERGEPTAASQRTALRAKARAEADADAEEIRRDTGSGKQPSPPSGDLPAPGGERRGTKKRLGSHGRRASVALQFDSEQLMLEEAELPDLLQMHRLFLDRLHHLPAAGAHSEGLNESLASLEEKIRALGGGVPSREQPTRHADAKRIGRQSGAGVVRRKALAADVFTEPGGTDGMAASPDAKQSPTSDMRPMIPELKRSISNLSDALTELNTPRTPRGAAAEAAMRVRALEEEKDTEARKRLAAEEELEEARARVQKANENVERLLGVIEEYSDGVEAEKQEVLAKLQEQIDENNKLREDYEALRLKMNQKVMNMHARNLEAIEVMADELELLEGMNKELEETLELEKSRMVGMSKQIDMQSRLLSLQEESHSLDMKMASLSSDDDEPESNDESAGSDTGAQE